MALKKRMVFDPLIDDLPGAKASHVIFFATFMLVFMAFGIFLKESPNVSGQLKTIFVIGAAAILVFSFTNLEGASIGLMFILPFVSLSLPGMNFFFTFSDVYLFVLSFSWATRIAVKRDPWIANSRLNSPIYIFVFLSIFSLIVSPAFFRGFKELIQTIEYFILTYLVFQSTLKTKENLDLLLLQLGISSMFVSLYGIFQWVQAGGGSEVRIMATFSHFNAFGAYLSLIIPLFFNLMLSERTKWKRYLFTAIFSIDLFAVLLTFSRGAWIGIFFAIIVTARLRAMQQLIKQALVAGFLIIGVSAILPIFASRTEEGVANRVFVRAASITDFSDTSTQSRFKQYKMAEDILVNNPLFGEGPGGVLIYASETNQGGNAEIHNVFLNIAAERGLPAAIAFISIFYVFFKMLLKKTAESSYLFFRTVYIGCITSAMSFLIVNMTAYHIVRGIGILLGIILAISAAAPRIEDNMFSEGAVIDEEEENLYLRRSPDLSTHISR